MSKYTTGEVAKLCSVSVRTVQYYDNRGILVPSQLSEGGRRLYSEEDLSKMKIICFLRDMDVSINSIGQLFDDEEPEKVIALLLEQQEKGLQCEISEQSKKLEAVRELKKQLKKFDDFSVESIGDIAHVMKNKKKLRKVRLTMLLGGLALDIVEAATLLYGIKTGEWLPFAIGMAMVLIGAVFISKYYYKKVDYICAQCHTVFKPAFKEAFFARHTPTTRKLTCPECNHKGFCVESYCEKSNSK